MKTKRECFHRFKGSLGPALFAWIAALCLHGLPAQAGNVAYWRFETADPAADSSENGHALNLTSVTSSTDVPPGSTSLRSAVFDGITSFAQTLAALDLSAARSLTVEFFAQSSQSGLGMLCEHSPDTGGRPGAFYVDFNENGSSFRVTQYSPAGFNVAYGAGPVRDGNWHHYAATMDNTGNNVVFNLYVDGTLLSNVTRAQGPATPGVNDIFNIGARNGSLFFYNGKLDEMRISDRVLQPAAFLRNQYTNVTFGITQNPAGTNVNEGQPVTFVGAASVTNAPAGVLEYQWLKNGVEIPGATQPSYILPSASYAVDHNAQIALRVSAAGIFISDIQTSSAATLTVIPDVTPPAALVTYAPAANFVTLVFDSPVDPTTAANAGAYWLADSGYVFGATLLPDGRSVVLNVADLNSPNYTVNFYGITDFAGNPASGAQTGTNTTGLIFADIGSVSLPGYVAATNETNVIIGATGNDIFGVADGCAYLYRTVTGDFDYRVRLEGVAGSYNDSTRGGMMIREDTAPGSRNIAVLTYANALNWVVTTRMAADGGTTIPGYPPLGLVPRTSPYPNAWLRVVRFGQTFNTYCSTNNVDWMALDTGITPEVPFADTLLIGIASSQISVGSPVNSPRAIFNYSGLRNASASAGTIIITRQPAGPPVVENRAATFVVDAILQGGDSSVLRFQWTTNGVNVIGATSSTLLLPRVPLSQSGLQVRCIVSAGASITPQTSAPATLTVTPDSVPPVPVTIAALGYSATLIFDELMDTVSANDPARYTLNGGHAVLSAVLQPDEKTVLLTTDGFTTPQFQLGIVGVADLAGNPATNSITGTVYQPEVRLVDIQGVNQTVTSISDTTPAGFTLHSIYGDIWASADSCSFAYVPMTNDFDVRAQFVEMEAPDGWGRGGLMVRISTDPASANLMVGTYRNSFESYIYTERPVSGALTGFGTAGQAPSFPNVWTRLQRQGGTFRGYYGADGLNWTPFTTITDLETAEVMLVGVAFSTCQLHLPTVGEVRVENFGPAISAPVRLSIRISGENAVIEWPSAVEGFQLQQSGKLGPEANWGNAPEQPVLTNGKFQVTQPLGSQRFYQLKR